MLGGSPKFGHEFVATAQKSKNNEQSSVTMGVGQILSKVI